MALGNLSNLLVAGLLLAASPVLAQQEPPANDADGGQDAQREPAPAEPVAPISSSEKVRRQKLIDDPLMDLEEDIRLERKFRIQIGRVLREGDLNSETRQLIDEWARWSMYRMTITEAPEPPEDDPEKNMQSNLQQAHELMQQTLRLVHSAGFNVNNRNQQREFRKFVCDKLIEYAEDVLDNNFHVRLNAVLLLSQMNIERDNPVPYVFAARPLIDVLTDGDQSDAVKVAAARGLKRILHDGQFNNQRERELKNEIVVAVIAELKNESSHWWFSWTLVQTLGCVDEPMISVQQPDGSAERTALHVHALAVTLRDKKRHWIVRSEAPRSLGRVPLDGSVRLDVITHEIVNLAHEMAAEYNNQHAKAQELVQKANDLEAADRAKANKLRNEAAALPRRYWIDCFLKVYLAFKPLNRAERERINGLQPPTLVTRNSNGEKTVTDAYGQVVPLVRFVLNDKPIPAQNLQNVQQWLNQNQPSNNNVAPGLPPLEQAQPMAANSDRKLEPATASAQ